MSATTTVDSSIWLKPAIKSLDKIIDCEKPKTINYSDIQKGSIINLEFTGINNDIHERTYIATSNWDKNKNTGCFINLYGKHLILSDRTLKNLNVCILGSLGT